jgi:hypothetical protein
MDRLIQRLKRSLELDMLQSLADAEFSSLSAATMARE